MVTWIIANRYHLRILETPEELTAVEDLQRLVWPGNETDIVPMHMLLAAVHNGGLAIGAYDLGDQFAQSRKKEANSEEEIQEIEAALELPPTSPLVGFVFGFVGLYYTPDGARPKHCSHMLGVHPEHRDRGLGFALKRAQWQMVRYQGMDLITWTYDPLLSRNAHLNISRLGAVCKTYIREAYGQMRDELNVGLPSDRFQVDWWITSQRVFQRLSKKPRQKLDLAHFLAAGTNILNPSQVNEDGWPIPPNAQAILDEKVDQENANLLLVEIPSNIMEMKVSQPALALEWRLHTRTLFEELFERGYWVTDFIFLPGKYPRSFYVLSHGESTL